MKKILLLVFSLASFAFTINATTYMLVEQKNGIVVKYDVDSVSKVTYYEIDSLPNIQGLNVSGKIDNDYYVDLGLPSGTLWAIQNVGAKQPTEYGNYYSYGEVNTKESYGNSTYFDAEYQDVATLMCGANWCVPSAVQTEELVENCEWTWLKDFNGTGVSGRLGTSKNNGKTIFLPAGGYYTDDVHYYASTDGHYWSSSYLDDLSSYSLYFDYSFIKADGKSFKYHGFTVRPVVVKK